MAAHRAVVKKARLVLVKAGMPIPVLAHSIGSAGGYSAIDAQRYADSRNRDGVIPMYSQYSQVLDSVPTTLSMDYWFLVPDEPTENEWGEIAP